MYKAPPNSFQLHFLSNGSSEREKTAVGSEYFDGKLFNNAFLDSVHFSLHQPHNNLTPLLW